MNYLQAQADELDKVKIGKNILQNTAALYSAELVAKATMFLLTILIARQLGSRQFGKLSFGIALVSIAALIGDLGISILITKEVSKDKKTASTYFSRGLATKLGLTVLMISLVLAYAKLAVLATDVRYVLVILALAFSVDSISLTFVAIFRAFQKMQFEGAIRIAQSLLNLTLGAYLLFSGYNIVAIATSMLLVNTISLILFWSINRHLKFAYFKFKTLSWQALIRLIRSALPFAVLTILVSLYFKIDVVLIEHIKGPTQVGQYAAAYKLLEAVIVISWVFSRALLPVLSSLFDYALDTLQKVAQTSFRFFIAIAIPIATATTFLAPKIIHLIYGNNYQQSILALQILIWAIVPIFISSTTITVIMASKKPQVTAYVALGQLIINLGLNLVLIPAYGINGAALATLATESSNVILHTIYIRRSIFAMRLHSFFIKPVFGAVTMSLVIVLYKSLILFPVYGFVYLLVLWLVKGIRYSDISLFRRLVLEGR